VHFLGAARAVTPSLHLLEIPGDGKRWVCLDSGSSQEDTIAIERRLPNGLSPSKLNAVILSHVHNDHVGGGPRLSKLGYSGPFYCTEPSNDLLKTIWPDSGAIQQKDARRFKTPLMFGEQDARMALRQLRPVSMGKRFSPVPGVAAEFLSASHLLGAAQTLLEIDFKGGEKRTLLYTGDLGRPGMPCLDDVAPVKYADYVICEGTYGDKLHNDLDPLNALADAVNRAYGLASYPDKKRGYGAILIPSFALGRAQTVAYYLRLLRQQGRIRPIRVAMDSPLAINITEVYRRHIHDFNRSDRKQAKHCDLFSLPGDIECRTWEESAKLDKPLSEPTIIVSSRGWGNGGRVTSHLLSRLEHPGNTVIWLGHQGEGTPGSDLTAGARSIYIAKHKLNVKATIEHLEGFSGHQDQREILDTLSRFKRPPRKLFLVHAEEAPATVLKAKIEKRLGCEVVIPHRGSHFDLT